MGFLSGLLRPAPAGADIFLAALREKVERDRLMAAQATATGDPAAAMQIRARSAAIDAQRTEAKEQARRARMGAMENGHRRPLEQPMDPGAADYGGGSGSGFDGGQGPGHELTGHGRSNPSFADRHAADGVAAGAPGAPIRLAALQAGLPAFPAGEGRGPHSQGRATGQHIATIASKPSATDNRIGDAKIAKGINGFGYVPSPEDHLVLARAIFAEASGAPADMDSIGAAIINRIRTAGPVSGRPENRRTLGDVLSRPPQYPFYPSEERPNGSAQWDLSGRPQDMNEQERAAWERAQKAAARVLSGRFRDPTHGSTFYFASRSFDGTPATAPDATFRNGIANGTFIPSDYRSPYPRRPAPDPRPTYFFDHIQDRPPKR